MSPHEETVPIQRSAQPLEPEVRNINPEGLPQQRHLGHQPTHSNASSSTCSVNSNTDESSDSYLDSLEEGRAPLLG